MVLVVSFYSGIGEEIINIVEILSYIVSPLNILSFSSKVLIIISQNKYEFETINVGFKDHKVQSLNQNNPKIRRKTNVSIGKHI